MPRIPSGRILVALLIFTGVVVGLNALTQFGLISSGELRRQFDFEEEANFTAWYGGALLLAASLAAGLSALSLYTPGSRAWRPYLLAAVGLAFLSVDEVAMVHEKLARIIRAHVAGSGRPPAIQWLWWELAVVVLYVLVALAPAWWARRELLVVLFEPLGRRSLWAGAGTFAVGAVVLDAGGELLPWMLHVALEDCLEFIGSALILHAFLEKLSPRLLLSSSLWTDARPRRDAPVTVKALPAAAACPAPAGHLLTGQGFRP